MSLAYLAAENVRCLERIELELHPDLNLIWGANGSGKTSILEAVFLLGRGRSFRTRNTERVIRHGAEQLTIFGRIPGPEARSEGRHSSADVASADPVESSAAESPSLTIGLQVSRGAPTIGKVGGAQAASLVELAQVFPVQVIDPSVHKLVEESGERRRRWMDWAVFHVEPGFARTWARYARALSQRNAALRKGLGQAAAWDGEISRAGEAIAEARRRSIDRLQPCWTETIRALLGTEVELTYTPGWAGDRTLADALAASRGRDELRGITHCGPHRADILLQLEGHPAREVASRGQQKLIAAAMILAQLEVLQNSFTRTPTLLLDDPAAELDGARLEIFIERVERLRCQRVLTSLDPKSGKFSAPDRVFHVEHGGGGRYNAVSQN